MSNSLLSNVNETPDGPLESPPLHPQVQAALLGLDVDLDQELARYRRQRLQHGGRSPRRQRHTVRPAPPPRIPTPAAALPPHPPALGAAGGNVGYGNAGHGNALAAARGDRLDPPIPDDYLESSEELLRSLAEDTPPLPTYPLDDDEPGLVASLLTPLGIGSMLLLLLSSATLGYVVLNPNVVGFPGLAWFGGDRAETLGDAAPSRTGGLPSPNLAQEEFVDIGLDTLSTLPRQGQASLPAPTAQPTAQPPASPTALPAAIANQLPAESLPTTSVVVSSATPSTPDPAPVESSAAVVYVPDPEPVRPAAAAPAPDPEPALAAAPASDGPFYYVVTDYSGDRSLEDARQVVGDAYVRNFPNSGAQVQFGAFSDPARAEALLEELSRQGISAEIYQP
jgi:hypothetical protein